MIETTRKCKSCKNKIVLEKELFIFQKDVYYHYDCFISTLTNKKRSPLSIENARVKADELLIESKRLASDIIAKNHLYSWLQRKYDIVTMPSYTFTKLESIFKGEYKGMSRPIPPEDLLDMFQRKWEDLCNTYNWNLSKGKNMDAVGRLNYDIAIILAKTSSYYAWKDTIKQKDESLKELLNEKKINFNAIVGKAKSTNEDYIIEDGEED